LRAESRQPAEVLAVAREHVEGINLCPLVVHARMHRIEVGHAILVEYDNLPSITKCLGRSFSAAATISGKRPPNYGRRSS
jgi:hypothetical protein